MTKECDLDERLARSAQRLREWNWMAVISTRPAEAMTILREEAKFLIRLGLDHPRKARRIGLLIVAYRKLIEAIDARMRQQRTVAAAGSSSAVRPPSHMAVAATVETIDV